VQIPKPEQKQPRRVSISVGGSNGGRAPETIESGESRGGERTDSLEAKREAERES
jgi:hypothetical protein